MCCALHLGFWTLRPWEITFNICNESVDHEILDFGIVKCGVNVSRSVYCQVRQGEVLCRDTRHAAGGPTPGDSQATNWQIATAAAGHWSQESNSKTAPVNGSLVPIEI